MMLRGILFFILTILFVGCGETPSHKEDVTLRTLYFVDSPVNGISYSCGVRKGLTRTDSKNGRHGAFYCKDEAVTFKLGTLTIGTIEQFVNGDEIHPQNFVKETPHDYFENEEVLKLAMLLQSLDDDGVIDEYINILPETVEKLQITSLAKLSMAQVKNEIIRVGHTPRNFEKMREHLIAHSHIPEIQDPMIISVMDNQAVGSYLDKIIPIESKQYISKIDIISEDGKSINGSDYFQIEKNGSIQLKKPLDFKTKNRYDFQIVAVTPLGSSKNAQLTINVNSSIEGEENFIHKPVVTNSTIYTKDSRYTVTIHGRKDTKIYINNELIKVMPSSESTTLTLDAPTKEGEHKYSIVLKYDNGIGSEPASYTVIKDKTAPIIETNSTLFTPENIDVIEAISVKETNKVDLEYSLNGEDKEYFYIDKNSGKLTFSRTISFEEPSDKNRDNRYEITIIVKDKAGNVSSKPITVEVTNILNTKPIIGTFNEEISTSLNVGDNIGTINIESGDAALEPLLLSGEGSENFQLNQDGRLTLIRRLNRLETFYLTVTARNEFGETTRDITITVAGTEKIAKAQINGELSGATVKMIKINSDNTQELIHTETTDSKGNFSLKTDLIKDNDFYIYEVTEGVDTSDSTENKGVLRLISKGSWIKNASNKIRITPLSEFLYDYVAKYVKYDYNQIENKIHNVSKILLDKSLDDDEDIDAKDIMIFNPLSDNNSLYPTLKYNDGFNNITNRLSDGNITYTDDLFNSYIFESFVGSDMKKVGSMVFTIDILESGEFRIYDLYTKNIIGKLKLSQPYNRPPNLGLPTLYVDTENNRAYVMNINGEMFTINISDVTNPKLLGTYDVGSSHILYAKDNYLFIRVNTGFGQTNIFDFNNPKNPIAVENPFKHKSVYQILNDKFYIWGDGSPTIIGGKQPNIEVYDVSVPKNINKVTEYNVSGTAISNFYINNNYLYVVTTHDNGSKFNIYQISEDNQLTLINSDNKISYTGKILDIQNNTLYFIDIQDLENIFVKQVINNVSLSNIQVDNNFIVSSSDIIALSSLSYLNSDLLSYYPSKTSQLIKKRNNTLYSATDSSLFILEQIDVSNLTKPKLIQSFTKDNQIGGHQMVNNLLYLGKYDDIIDVYNIDDLTTALTSIDLKQLNSPKGSLSEFKIFDNILFVRDHAYSGYYYNIPRLQKFNISDIYSPILLGEMNGTNIQNIVSFKENNLYVQSSIQGNEKTNYQITNLLKTIDWSNNTNPLISDTIEDLSVQKILWTNNYAYLLGYPSIQMFANEINSSTKINDYIDGIQSNGQPRYIKNMLIQNNKLYYSTYEGLTTLEINNPYAIEKTKKYNTQYFQNTSFHNFIIEENIMYSNGSDGLKIIDMNLFDKSNL